MSTLNTESVTFEVTVADEYNVSSCESELEDELPDKGSVGYFWYGSVGSSKGCVVVLECEVDIHNVSLSEVESMINREFEFVESVERV